MNLPQAILEKPRQLQALYLFQKKAREDPVGWLKQYAGFEPWRKDKDSEGFDQLDMLTRGVEWGTDDFWAHFHGSGKTALLALLAIQGYVAYAPSIKVPILPPTFESGEDVLWPEIMKWVAIINNNTVSVEYPTGAFFEWFGSPHRDLKWECPKYPECYIRVLNPMRVESGQGRKAKYIRLICDEVTKWVELQFEIVQAMRSGAAYFKLIAACNPINRDSLAYVNFEQNPQYRKTPLNAENHPNIRLRLNPGDKGFMDGMISWEYIRHMREECAREVNDGDYTRHPSYQGRVLGMWPEIGEGFVLVPDAWFDEALKTELSLTNERTFGLDVSRGGDKTVLYIVDWADENKGTIIDVKVWAGAYISKKMMLEQDREGVTTEEIASYCKEQNALEGTVDNTFNPAIAEDLSEYGLKVTGVNFGNRCQETIYDMEKGENVPKFGCMADEILWHLREGFQEGRIAISKNIPLSIINRLRGDLKRYFTQGKGGYAKIQVEPKDIFRKRIKRSPDDGDSCACAWHKPFRLGTPLWV